MRKSWALHSLFSGRNLLSVWIIIENSWWLICSSFMKGVSQISLPDGLIWVLQSLQACLSLEWLLPSCFLSLSQTVFTQNFISMLQLCFGFIEFQIYDWCSLWLITKCHWHRDCNSFYILEEFISIACLLQKILRPPLHEYAQLLLLTPSVYMLWLAKWGPILYLVYIVGLSSLLAHQDCSNKTMCPLPLGSQCILGSAGQKVIIF